MRNICEDAAKGRDALFRAPDCSHASKAWLRAPSMRRSWSSSALRCRSFISQRVRSFPSGTAMTGGVSGMLPSITGCVVFRKKAAIE